MDTQLQKRNDKALYTAYARSGRVMRGAAAGEGGDASWEGDAWQPSAEDMAAVDSCLGTLDGAHAGNDWSVGQSALASGAVKLLQAFIDSNG